MRGPVDRVIASLTRAWLGSSSGSWRRLPRPLDEPYVHAAGDDPDRVLVVGNGVAMSYGVLSHQIGFGGHLARQLAERTGRGSEVHLVVDVELDPRAAATAITASRPARFDAIVLTLGGAEGIRLMSPRDFRRDFDALLDVIAELGAPTTETLVVAIPPVTKVVRLPSFAERRIAHRMLDLNREAQAAAEGRARVTYLPFEPRGTDLVRTRDRSTYEEWGGIVADGLAPRLDAIAGQDHDVQWFDERERMHALEDLGVLDVPGDDPRFEQIMETAKSLFGVDTASLNFIDGQRQRVKAVSRGGVRNDVERTQAICNVTIRQPGVMVIRDALADPAFRSLEPVRDGQVRFYAGYPIEAPNGMRVGALCLLDPEPRSFSRADQALLRELALRVQSLLRQSAAA